MNTNTVFENLEAIKGIKRRVNALERLEFSSSGSGGGVPTALARGDMIAANSALAWTRLPLSGAAGSILTRNATDPTWSAFYLSGTAGQTYTLPTSGGTIPTSPGTLSVSTLNAISAAGVITHAITSSANPGAAASILASNASGYLQLVRLGIGVAPDYDLHIEKATGASVVHVVNSNQTSLSYLFLGESYDANGRFGFLAYCNQSYSEAGALFKNTLTLEADNTGGLVICSMLGPTRIMTSYDGVTHLAERGRILTTGEWGIGTTLSATGETYSLFNLKGALQFVGDSSSQERAMLWFEPSWINATDASRTSKITLSVVLNTVKTPVMDIDYLGFQNLVNNTIRVKNYTLTVAKGGTVPVGTGTAGQMAEWVTDANTLQAAKLIGPTTHILTLTTTAACTLAMAISAGKILTLTTTDSYNLTIAATGTLPVGTGIANYVARWSDANELTTGALQDTGTNVGIGGAGNATLDVKTANTAYDATAAVARITNSAGTGQSPFDFYFGGNLKSRVRADYAGNINFVSVGGGYYLYTDGDYGVGRVSLSLTSTNLNTICTDDAANFSVDAHYFDHRTSETPLVNYGIRSVWRLDSSINNLVEASAIDVSFTDPTEASYTTALKLSAYDAGGERVGLSIFATGTAAYLVAGGYLQTVGRRQAVAIKSGGYTLTENDEVVVFTATATASLPGAKGTDQTYRIVCRAGTTTILPDGGDTIKGQTSWTLIAGDDLIITDTASGYWE